MKVYSYDALQHHSLCSPILKISVQKHKYIIGKSTLRQYSTETMRGKQLMMMIYIQLI